MTRINVIVFIFGGALVPCTVLSIITKDVQSLVSYISFLLYTNGNVILVQWF